MTKGNTGTRMDGGYDDGYNGSRCFWGSTPGSLVHRFLSVRPPPPQPERVLDLGCGEGKNALAFARAGARVTAVDCSGAALANGKTAHSHERIEWIQSDAEAYLQASDPFDIVIMYGLLHCLPSPASIEKVIGLALVRTRPFGIHIVAVFNDGPHDLSAHPDFRPTLLPHSTYVAFYAGHKIEVNQNELIHEVHPHNNIPHFHSITRLTVRRLP